MRVHQQSSSLRWQAQQAMHSLRRTSAIQAHRHPSSRMRVIAVGVQLQVQSKATRPSSIHPPNQATMRKSARRREGLADDRAGVRAPAPRA